MSLKTTDLMVKNTEEKNYQVTQISEWFEFKDGERTPLGWKYEIVLPRLRFEKVMVKIAGQKPLFEAEAFDGGETKTVTFDNLTIGFYTQTTKGSEFVNLLLTAKADNIHLAK